MLILKASLIDKKTRPKDSRCEPKVLNILQVNTIREGTNSLAWVNNANAVPLT